MRWHIPRGWERRQPHVPERGASGYFIRSRSEQECEPETLQEDLCGLTYSWQSDLGYMKETGLGSANSSERFWERPCLAGLACCGPGQAETVLPLHLGNAEHCVIHSHTGEVLPPP